MMMARRCIWMGVVVISLEVKAMATVYTVGDSAGWALGVDYGTWSSSKSFIVGDSLVFNYGSGHTVDEVGQSDYTKCTFGNPINTDNKGTTKILLQTPGSHYFICGVIGHCGSGMKLSVNVLASGGPITSPNSTSTTTTSPTSGTYPTTTTTPTTMIPDSVASPATLSSLQGALVICGMAFANLALLL